MEAEGIERHYTRMSMLGRNDIQLGDLYNYRNDRVVKGKVQVFQLKSDGRTLKIVPRIFYRKSAGG